MLAEDVRWFDDWFALQPLAPGVTAIGEPRFHQTNWNYLIEGREQALLFDTGPGVRDIAPVAAALTRKPLLVLPSHLHFDHTGNLHRFENVALADLPLLRDAVADDVLIAPDHLFLGAREGMSWKPVRVSRWLPVGGTIDLGSRSLTLIHTPGHSPDSISLLDAGQGMLFAADFVYPGPLYAQVPGADLSQYLDSARRLLPLLGETGIIACAHGQADAEGRHAAPILARADIADLAASLERLRASGAQPAEWPVNERMNLLIGPHAYAPWQGG